MYEPHANVTDLGSEYADWDYAGWLRRVAASLIDAVVLLGGMFAGFMAVGAWESAAGSSGSAGPGLVAMSLIAAVFLYEPICHRVWQRTVGKRAMGIALATASGERASFGRVLWRHVAKLGLGIVPLLGLLDALNPLASKKNQTVHDAVASTIVVRVQ
jgi:uncharacterized RDD family membrane protein YckC